MTLLLSLLQKVWISVLYVWWMNEILRQMIRVLDQGYFLHNTVSCSMLFCCEDSSFWWRILLTQLDPCGTDQRWCDTSYYLHGRLWIVCHYIIHGTPPVALQLSSSQKQLHRLIFCCEWSVQHINHTTWVVSKQMVNWKPYILDPVQGSTFISPRVTLMYLYTSSRFVLDKTGH